MKKEALKLIEDALCTTEASCDLTIHTEKFSVYGYGLMSCRESETEISFSSGRSDIPLGTLYIETDIEHLKLLVSTQKFAREENFPPSPPINGYKTTWEGGAFPKEWVLSCFQNLTDDKGFPYQMFEDFFKTDKDLIYVYVPVYKLIGYYCQKYPVFEVDESVLKQISFDPQSTTYQQGHLRCFPVICEGLPHSPSRIREWEQTNKFFNHWREHKHKKPTEDQVTTEGIMIEGVPFAIILLDRGWYYGEEVIYSEDHEDLVLPPGDYVVAHSLLED